MASKHYHIKLNFDSDREVIDRIESKENKNDYIRRLVLSDIAADYLQGMIQVDDQDPEDGRIADPFRFRCWVREKVCRQLLNPNDPIGCNACPYQCNIQEDGSFDCRIDSMSLIELEDLINGEMG